MPVSLRIAEAADVPLVGELQHRSQAAAYAALMPPAALERFPAAMRAAWWLERWGYERETHVLTVAERDGRLVGFSYVGPDEEREPDTGLLYSIHLDPAEQGRGTGRELMIDALATLHGQGWRQAALWVLVGNDRARRFYERGGWHPTGWSRDSGFGFSIKETRYTCPLP